MNCYRTIEVKTSGHCIINYIMLMKRAKNYEASKKFHGKFTNPIFAFHNRGILYEHDKEVIPK